MPASGILAIAALCLGARFATGEDIDPKAVDVAYENAALNGIGRENYTVRAGDVLNDKKLAREFGGEYDIVVANIVADVIIGLAPKVRSLLKEGGLFLCSGIIDDRAEEVAGALRAAVTNGRPRSTPDPAQRLESVARKRVYSPFRTRRIRSAICAANAS